MENIGEPNKYEYTDHEREYQIKAVEGGAVTVDTDIYGEADPCVLRSYEQVSEFIEKLEEARRVAYSESHVQARLREIRKVYQDYHYYDTDKVFEVIEGILRKEIARK